MPALVFSQESLPLVAVMCKIEATDFTDNLTKESLKYVEDETAKDLKVLGKRYLGFLDWSPANCDLSQAKACFMVTVEDGFAEHGLPGILLKYSAIMPNATVDLSQIEPDILYEYGKKKPTQNKELLKNKILEMLNTRFANSDFRKKLQDHFLSKIPLASSLESLPESQRLVIPIEALVLNARNGSTFSAEFVSQLPPQSEEDCNIILEKDGTCRAQSHYGKIRVQSIEYNLPPRKGVGWDSEIPARLDKQKKGTLQVFVKTYEMETVVPTNSKIKPLGSDQN